MSQTRAELLLALPLSPYEEQLRDHITSQVSWQLQAPPAAVWPPAPVWGSKSEWRQWKRDRKEWQRAQRRGADHDDETLAADERVGRFRRNAGGSGVTIGTLATINLAASPHFLRVLLPAFL